MFVIPLGSATVDNPPLRFPAELVRYVRTEYGDSSPEWLLSSVRQEAKNRSHDKARRSRRRKAALKVHEGVAFS